MKENAEAVQRMMDAGAILLAVTTVPESAMWVETNTLAYGKSCNPYDSRRIVGGSSGGEGALHGAAASLVSLLALFWCLYSVLKKKLLTHFWCIPKFFTLSGFR